jgi:hypothetical protein
MEDFFRPFDERQRRIPLQWHSRLKLDASLWASAIVFGWETPLRSLLVVDAPPFAGWISLILAFGAMVTAVQVKRRLRQELTVEREPRSIVAPNPLSLNELLRTHGVREHNSFYLYMPLPKRAEHKAAWAWIETLGQKGLIKSDPRRVKTEYIKETVKQSYADLFAGDVGEFEIYWLDAQKLEEIIGDALP